MEFTHKKIKVQLRAPGNTSETIRFEVRRQLDVDDYEQGDFGYSVRANFASIMAHTVSAVNLKGWQPLSTLDIYNKELVLENFHAWLEAVDAVDGLVTRWYEVISELYKPADEDLGPEPLPEDAEKKG